jgi:hypothetical protein
MAYYLFSDQIDALEELSDGKPSEYLRNFLDHKLGVSNGRL